MATAYHDLVTRFRTEGVGKLQRDTNRASRALGNFSKAGRRGTFIIQNLAEGAADAQYGLRNIGNNAEVVIGQFGELVNEAGSTKDAFKSLGRSLIGPTGVIGALILLINFAPQIIGWFQTWINNSSKAQKAIDKFNDSLNETTKLTPDESHLENINKRENELLAEKTKLINQINTDRDKGAGVSKKKQEALRVINEKLNVLQQDRIATIKRINKAEAESEAVEVGKQQNKTYEMFNKHLQRNLELLQAQGSTAQELLEAEQREIESLLSGGEDASIKLLGDEAYEELVHRLAVLKAKLAELGDEGIDTGDKFKQFAGSLITSFDSAASSAGNFFENLGKGLLSTIGSYLIKEGTAAVLSGKTKIASGWGAGLGLSQVQAGYAEIAGGVALKAGAASIGRSSGSGGGGANTSSPAGSGGGAATGAPLTRAQGSSQTVRVIGEIRGQDIRLLNQRSEDSYSGLS